MTMEFLKALVSNSGEHEGPTIYLTLAKYLKEDCLAIDRSDTARFSQDELTILPRQWGPVSGFRPVLRIP